MLAISSTYNAKSKGYNTEPCLTPKLSLKNLDHAEVEWTPYFCLTVYSTQSFSVKYHSVRPLFRAELFVSLLTPVTVDWHDK